VALIGAAFAQENNSSSAVVVLQTAEVLQHMLWCCSGSALVWDEGIPQGTAGTAAVLSCLFCSGVHVPQVPVVVFVALR
jgi:hypothetical protein